MVMALTLWIWMMAKITTTRYAIQWYRPKNDAYIDIDKFGRVDDAKEALFRYKQNDPYAKYRLVRETESREVIG